MKRDTSNWKMETKKCENCIKDFTAPVWRKKRFCGYSCARLKTGTKGKKIQSLSGKNHYLWIEDRTKLKDDHKDRGGQLHRGWSNLVKKRDGWKCKINNKDCNGNLEAHHILSWREYPELRYEINNGITLCQTHHPRKRIEEARLSPYFQTLVIKTNQNVRG